VTTEWPSTKHLWGSTVREHVLNLAEHYFALRVEVPRREGPSDWYLLRMDGVRSLHLYTSDYLSDRAYLLEPWNYVELTTITIAEEQRASSSWKVVTIEFWETKCTIACRSVHVDKLDARSE